MRVLIFLALLGCDDGEEMIPRSQCWEACFAADNATFNRKGETDCSADERGRMMEACGRACNGEFPDGGR